MNTKDNQRTRLSKMLFKNALMDLMKEKDSVSKISVRELCETAGLNRSTFYAHYNEPKDLLNELEYEILDSTKEHLEKIGAENDIGAHKYILSFLKYIKDNDKPFRSLLIDSADPQFRTRFMQQTIVQFVENLDVSFPKEIEQFVYSYILNGSSGILIQWIRSDYECDENIICELLYTINNGALTQIEIN